MKPVFSLVDCNNFYASCEKLFRPDLAGRPVIVLSNNDGAVVARSAEAKALGIKMGVPVFKIRDEIKRHRIVSFSSNYSLYADLSSRVMSSLEEMAPRVEVYSIDEAFLDLTGIEKVISLTDFGEAVRERIGRWIGITVCVGIAPTKTLAKLANHAAKSFPATRGVVDLTSPVRQKRLLSIMPVEEVWGVGGRLTKRLNAMGITTALDLAQANPKVIREQFSVVLERTVAELNGESCIAFEEIAPTKKQIVCSRSFGERITEFQQLRQAVSDYASRAAEKLRVEKQKAGVVSIFVRTGMFNAGEPQYSNSATSRLLVPSNDTRDIVRLARELLIGIWRDGVRYAKAGVMLADFSDTSVTQGDLFSGGPKTERDVALMEVIDRINRDARGQVRFAGSMKREWQMKRQHLSPAYTTRWSDLPRLR